MRQHSEIFPENIVIVVVTLGKLKNDSIILVQLRIDFKALFQSVPVYISCVDKGFPLLDNVAKVERRRGEKGILSHKPDTGCSAHSSQQMYNPILLKRKWCVFHESFRVVPTGHRILDAFGIDKQQIVGNETLCGAFRE